MPTERQAFVPDGISTRTYSLQKSMGHDIAHIGDVLNVGADDRPVVVLSALHADGAGLELVCRIVRSELMKDFRIHVLVGGQDFDFDNVPFSRVGGKAEYRHQLARLCPMVVQTFCAVDHAWAAMYCFLQAEPPFLLATHALWNPVPRRGLLSKLIYNRWTDVNLFVCADTYRQSGANGRLGLKNPCVLNQAQLGPDSVIAMLRHAWDSLLFQNRRDICGLDKSDYSDLRLSYVTHFYCNQSDIGSVTRLLERYAQYPEDIRAKVQFVVVDDGSPIQYSVPTLPLNLTWLKIDVDIPWNQAGARNLGATYARADTVLLTDLDHEVPEESLRNLLSRKPCGKRLYKMWRCQDGGRGEIYKGHSNLFVMSRGRFMECHGYDEEFSGSYGAEDFRFVKYQKAQGSLQTYLPKSIFCFERTDIDRNKSYHSLKRDLSFNTAVDSRKKRELALYGRDYGHSRKFLDFTWTLASDQRFLQPVSRQVRRSWKRWAWLRQILPRF
jgi:hypothetical protein